MTPDEQVEAIVASMRVVSRDGSPRWAEAADTIEALARDHAALLKQRDEDRAWMKRAADVLRAMLSTLADYPTVEEMNETRFADLRGYMVDAETDLLATLLAEFDVLRERP